MPPKLDATFTYRRNPQVLVRATSPETGESATFRAIVDTGADRTVLDSLILVDIDPDPEFIALSSVDGAGGGSVDVAIYDVELSLLDREDMRIRLPVAFAVGIERSVGNLIGLDILEHFDFALSHADRLGYLGRR